jgi:Tfp pilus assembly protein PilP
MTMALPLILVCALAQVPNPAAAIGAAKDARAKTEAAQQKNAEALSPGAPGAPGASGAQGAGAQGAPGAQGAGAPGAQGAQGAPPAPPPPQGAGYTYDPDGRRDPFVSLNSRGADVPPTAGQRPQGIAGLLVNEVTVKGVLKSGKGGFIALVQSPDNRTYILKAGDKVFDGTVKAISQDAVVFSQDVNDPLSLVKQREVRKGIRPEER